MKYHCHERLQVISNNRTIWILTDGKAGDRIQCLGVAIHLDGEITEKVIDPGMWSLSPQAMLPPRDRPDSSESIISPPFPDVVIASGRRAHPYLTAIKKAGGDKVFTVFLKDPRVVSSTADLIWVPEHDKLRGDNVVVSLTAPHPITPEELAKNRATSHKRFANYQGKHIGLVLGGVTRGVSWNEETCLRLAERLSQLPIKDHSVLAVASRRTPQQMETCIKNALAKHNLFYWNGDDGSDNPYRQILALSDTLIVTGDSHNMVSEALAAGVPTYVFRPTGLKQKMHQFLSDLEDRKLARNFVGEIDDFPTSPIDATESIAQEILTRIDR